MPEGDLATFLEVAEDLLIRGLSEINKEGSYLNLQESPEKHDKKSAHSLNKKTSTKSYQAIHGFISNDINSKDTQLPTERQSKIVKKEETEEEAKSMVLLTREKHYPCEKCEKQFYQRSHLNDHNSSVHDGVRYPCDQCDYNATAKSSLTKHVRSIHENISVTVSCEKCDKQFRSKTNLWQHNSTVPKGVRYQCVYCDYQATERKYIYVNSH